MGDSAGSQLIRRTTFLQSGHRTGAALIFSSNRRGTHELYQKPVAGDRNEAVLLSTGQPVNPTDWSRDGRIVLFNSRDPKSGSDIWALPLDGKPFPIVQTAFDEQAAQFAPDGHWIAYQSNESGVAEVYVRPFPGPGERFAVSIGGGTQVRWGRDGKELFYVARDGQLMAVPIQLTSNTPESAHPSRCSLSPSAAQYSKATPATSKWSPWTAGSFWSPR